jgi:hypothetical protein
MRTRAFAVLLAAFLLSCIGGSATAGHWGHWNDNEPSYHRGYAFIQDQTPAAYPVYTAAIDWDSAPKLDLVWRSGANGCGHCVPFVATAVGGAGCTGTVGETYNLATNGVHITNADVRVDSACSGQAYGARLELVCHEMGHAIGILDRAASAASCMRGTGLGGQPDGSAADFTELNSDGMYGHDS